MWSKENADISELAKGASMKIYANNEGMINSTRHYRTIFEEAELTYLNAEFSFYNKKFDEDDWECTLNMKCFEVNADGLRGNQICDIETKDFKVTRDMNLVVRRDGWGMDAAGAFWKKGSYFWVGYVNGTELMSCKCTVYNYGKVSPDSNPYFKFTGMRFYQGFDDLREANDGYRYMKELNGPNLEYLGIEVEVTVMINDAFDYEIFFTMLDDNGAPKAFFEQSGHFNKGEKGNNFYIRQSWGNKEKNTYKPGFYHVSVMHMEQYMCSAGIHMKGQDIEGFPDNVHIGSIAPDLIPMQEAAITTTRSLAELQAELNELIGLKKIKQSIDDFITYTEFNKLRVKQGFKDDSVTSLHSVFTGNPGTGKTTVVRLLGGIYNALGLLSRGHVVEVSRVELVGKYIGQTAPQTRDMIEKARGGILFVDEAYSLARMRDDMEDFGREVIEVLIKEMSDGKGDIAIVFAGYTGEMKTFLESNSGLKSRISQFYHFDDYTPEELMQIAELAGKKEEITLSDEAKDLFEKYLTRLYRDRDKTFGNARLAVNIVDRAKRNMANRVMRNPDATKEEISFITKEDVLPLFTATGLSQVSFDIDEALLDKTMQELNELVGLESVKKEMKDMVTLVRYYIETGVNPLGKFSLNFTFSGNPGTGKTTVARIIGNMFNALGILERGHVIEVDRNDLVAGYSGQTAIKAQQVIDSAMGGILFIDEAYSLTHGNDSDIGREAVEILLKEMEDKRGQFGVIVAGYPDKMKLFLESNPGLLSRFNQHLVFDDYSADELMQIVRSFFAKEQLNLSKEADDKITSIVKNRVEAKDSFFGNGRYARQLADVIIKNQQLRLARLLQAERLQADIFAIIPDDVEEVAEFQHRHSGGIGFR